jgi:hypothetical protein
MSDYETISDNGTTVQVQSDLARDLRVLHALQVLAGAMQQNDWPSETQRALVMLVLDLRERVNRMEGQQ